ncbi:DUF4365 domain-containing protein [Herpetosiphon geysericola]|nr:DUF4365 domain-containing protein [Herpetosiphon geysericola]
MSSLPIRNRKHVLEEESRKFVGNIIPSEWIIRGESPSDYGIDMQIELVLNERVTGASWSIQLKATDKLERKKDVVTYSFKTSTLAYFLARPERIIYIMYDAVDKVAYWIWIQEYIRNDLEKTWLKQKTATVKIPKTNIFNNDAIPIIQNRVLHDNEAHRWLSAVQTANHPYFSYQFQSKDNGFEIGVSPRYPGADQDSPVSINGTFRFDASEHGRANLQKFKDMIRTGIPAEFDSSVFEGFNVHDIFYPIMPELESFQTSKILISSIPGQNPQTIKVSFFDKHGTLVQRFPFIELVDVQSGTEEVTFTNKAQKLSITTTMTVSKVSNTINISFGFDHGPGTPIQTIYETITAMMDMNDANSIEIINLQTDTVLIRDDFKDYVTEIPSQFVQLIEALMIIQERCNIELIWPDSLEPEDAERILFVATILFLGKVRVHNPITVPLLYEGAEKLLRVYQAKNSLHLRGTSAAKAIDILGFSIELGDYVLYAPEVTMSVDDLQSIDTFIKRGKLQDVLLVTFHTGEVGAELIFPQWIPVMEDEESGDNDKD